MASGSYRQVNVQCCFYRFDDGSRRVTCEGLVEGGSTTLTFPSQKDFEIQMETFCCRWPGRCEVHRMLRGKYEEE